MSGRKRSGSPLGPSTYLPRFQESEIVEVFAPGTVEWQPAMVLEAPSDRTQAYLVLLVAQDLGPVAYVYENAVRKREGEG